MFKQHLEMIGRNETPSKKAKFWQSYIRSLKGNTQSHNIYIKRTRIALESTRTSIETVVVIPKVLKLKE